MLRSLLFALAALLFAAPAAQACTDQPLVEAVHAVAGLRVVPGRARPDWTLAGASRRVRRSPVGRRRRARSRSRRARPPSPTPICITPAHPTLRFFARGTGVLAVSVIADGGLELPVGVVARPRAALVAVAGPADRPQPARRAGRALPVHERARLVPDRRRLDRPLQQGLNPDREQREVVAQRVGHLQPTGARRSPARRAGARPRRRRRAAPASSRAARAPRSARRCRARARRRRRAARVRSAASIVVEQAERSCRARRASRRARWRAGRAAAGGRRRRR